MSSRIGMSIQLVMDVFCQGKEIPKQTLVPRYSGLSREVVSSQGGLSRGGYCHGNSNFLRETLSK